MTTMLLMFELGLLRTLPESSSSDPLYGDKNRHEHETSVRVTTFIRTSVTHRSILTRALTKCQVSPHPEQGTLGPPSADGAQCCGTVPRRPRPAAPCSLSPGRKVGRQHAGGGGFHRRKLWRPAAVLCAASAPPAGRPTRPHGPRAPASGEEGSALGTGSARPPDCRCGAPTLSTGSGSDRSRHRSLPVSAETERLEALREKVTNYCVLGNAQLFKQAHVVVAILKMCVFTKKVRLLK